jgi:hypothetical protein
MSDMSNTIRVIANNVLIKVKKQVKIAEDNREYIVKNILNKIDKYKQYINKNNANEITNTIVDQIIKESTGNKKTKVNYPQKPIQRTQRNDPNDQHFDGDKFSQATFERSSLLAGRPNMISQRAHPSGNKTTDKQRSNDNDNRGFGKGTNRDSNEDETIEDRFKRIEEERMNLMGERNKRPPTPNFTMKIKKRGQDDDDTSNKIQAMEHSRNNGRQHNNQNQNQNQNEEDDDQDQDKVLKPQTESRDFEKKKFSWSADLNNKKLKFSHNPQSKIGIIGSNELPSTMNRGFSSYDDVEEGEGNLNIMNTGINEKDPQLRKFFTAKNTDIEDQFKKITQHRDTKDDDERNNNEKNNGRNNNEKNNGRNDERNNNERNNRNVKNDDENSKEGNLNDNYDNMYDIINRKFDESSNKTTKKIQKNIKQQNSDDDEQDRPRNVKSKFIKQNSDERSDDEQDRPRNVKSKFIKQNSDDEQDRPINVKSKFIKQNDDDNHHKTRRNDDNEEDQEKEELKRVNIQLQDRMKQLLLKIKNNVSDDPKINQLEKVKEETVKQVENLKATQLDIASKIKEKQDLDASIKKMIGENMTKFENAEESIILCTLNNALHSPCKKVTSIELKDIDLPFMKYNINSNNNNLRFKLTKEINNVDTDIDDSIIVNQKNNDIELIIAVGNYNIVDLLEILNKVLSKYEIVISLNKNSNIITFKSDNKFDMIFDDDTLFNNLGFPSQYKTKFSGSNKYNGVKNYDFKNDKFINIFISNINETKPVMQYILGQPNQSKKIIYTPVITELNEINLKFTDSKGKEIKFDQDLSITAVIRFIDSSQKSIKNNLNDDISSEEQITIVKHLRK